MKIILFICFYLFVHISLNAQQIDQKLQNELRVIYENDQYVRQYADSISKAYDYKTPDSLYQLVHEKWVKTDSVNLVKVEAIISEHGYPGKNLVGNQSEVVFFILQHADLAVQKKYFSHIKKAVARGDIKKESFAKMIDRIRVREGKKQLYGTQFRIYKGKVEYFAIEDPENLNRRRKEMNLEPFDGDVKFVE